VIPYGHQSIDDDDIAAVVSVLKGDWLTQGPAVEAFEQQLADAVEARFAVAFTNGTAALQAAVAVAGIGSGDTVATSPLSFSASAACARYSGAAVRFIDVDIDTMNMDITRVAGGIDAVVAVHYAGLPVDMSQMPVRPRGVIEDAAHALGARTADGPVGNCAHSDLCCFSFHPVKTITTGEGGAVTTNDARLHGALRRFRNHGIEPRPSLGPWYYEISDLGLNLRLTDIQAALGQSQLAKLDRFVERRNALAERYDRRLAATTVRTPPGPPTGVTHGRHLYPVRVPNRDQVFTSMRAAGIGVQVHYVPLYRHPVYAEFAPGGRAAVPGTEAVYGGQLSLPLFPALREDEQEVVLEQLAAALKENP
jgi:dTDP-4-amino-4,6-dideoxygalactose transaminase